MGFEIKRYYKDVHLYCLYKENSTCNTIWLNRICDCYCLILFARILMQYSSASFVLSFLEFRGITLDTESTSVSPWCFQRLRHECIYFFVINSFSHLYWSSKRFRKCLLNSYEKWSGLPVCSKWHWILPLFYESCVLYYSQHLSGLWSFPTASHLQNWLICFLPIIPETIARRKPPEGTFSQLALEVFWRHFSAFPYYRLWHQTIEIRIRVWTSRKDTCS